MFLVVAWSSEASKQRGSYGSLVFRKTRFDELFTALTFPKSHSLSSLLRPSNVAAALFAVTHFIYRILQSQGEQEWHNKLV